MVVCVRICATWLVCIQAWIYQRTSFCSSNLKLNQDSSDLPSRLSIWSIFIELMRWCASPMELALIPKLSTQRVNNVGRVWCFHKMGDSWTGKYPWGAKSLTIISKSVWDAVLFHTCPFSLHIRHSHQVTQYSIGYTECVFNQESSGKVFWCIRSIPWVSRENSLWYLRK